MKLISGKYYVARGKSINNLIKKIQFNKTAIASWAADKYGIESTCKKYIELYESLL